MRLRKISTLVILLFSGITWSYAQEAEQTEVKNSEAKKFAQAFIKVYDINQQMVWDMAEAVREEGLEVDRFNEIVESQQNPDAAVPVMDPEMQQFEAALNRLREIQDRALADMEQKINEEGLTAERYNEISLQIEYDDQLQQQVEKHMEKELR